MASMLQRVVKIALPKKIVDTDSQLLHALQEGSEVLQNITDQFAPLMKRFRVFFFLGTAEDLLALYPRLCSSKYSLM